MAANHTSLFVSRTFLQAEHAELLRHQRPFNHNLTDVTLQWRRLGEVGVMLVQAGEYGRLTSRPGSKLARQTPVAVAKKLNEGLLAGRERQQVDLAEAAFLDVETDFYVHIGYPIISEELAAERRQLEADLNGLNGPLDAWPFDFRPYLSIATLNRTAQSDDVLAAFQGINPGTAILYPPKAHPC